MEMFVSFLKTKNELFHNPNVPDLSYVKDDDIKFILPEPTVTENTARQQSCFKFLMIFHI